MHNILNARRRHSDAHAAPSLPAPALIWNRIPLLLLAVALMALMLGRTALADPEFLQPDQAFKVSARADGPNAVRIRWDIAEGYYLYQSKFRVDTDTVGIALGQPQLPEAEIKQDEFFGAVPIYHETISARVPVTRDPGAGNRLDLKLTSQGCAEAGLCYPPHRQTLSVEMPPMAATQTATPPPTQTSKPSAASTLGLNDAFGVAREGALPTVEEAFRFQAEVAAPDRLQLTWDIAPETYLYRHLVQVALEDEDGVRLGSFELPQGETKRDAVLPDGSLGDIQVYHDRIDLTLPLLRDTLEPTEITLVVKYQGCAELGVCYPPQTQQVRLDLPAASTTASAPTATTRTAAPSAPEPSDSLPVAEQDRIAAVLAGGSLWVIIAAFFGFGLLLAFTPCIFPMIPILSGIIAGQGARITTRKAFILSLVYVLAMALTYTLAGVLAGLFGANLQVLFQNPWILSAFALVFVLLALSMFGFYDLQLPSSLQTRLATLSNRQQGGTLIGVAIMGLLSALIVGPCVAPPLFGALIYISQTGDALLGGLALFALSLGMGAPLIVIGTSAGKLLPRAGVWMDAVKAVFGVALLGVAILLLERILPPAVAMLLWGLLAICSAVYLGALSQLPHDSSGWSKLWKGFGVALLVYGVLMLVGAAAGGKDTVQPLRGLMTGIPAQIAEHTAFQRIKTTDDLERALAEARAADRPTMLDFYADWCVSCKEMERYTFSDPAVMAEMSRFNLLQADVTANDAADRALIQERFGIPGPPAILFFDPNGAEQTGMRVVGFKPAEDFAKHLKSIQP
ncbi:protein-disulfide reductase DsbD [Thiorhodococcus fuscus]|uniref:Thiol:disulfide interchange protein DsbD n=1 Tax=Thiorhodococcus fuscus TaxID=527200 RepID=A0ABW4Y7U3_9GAMM